MSMTTEKSSNKIRFTEPILEEYLEKYGKKYGPERQSTFLNSHGSIGIIEISTKEEPWYWVELKTPGYPPKNFVGTYCLIGGNWVRKEDKNPLEVYKREINEEIKCKIPKTFDGESVDVRIVRELMENIRPVGDYFSHTPKEVHGNPKQDDFNIVFSLFETKIEGSRLGEILGLKKDFSLEDLSKKISEIQEYDPGVLKLQNFKDGLERQFCWGCDRVLWEYLNERYSFAPRMKFFEGIVVGKLKSSPLTPFEERETVGYYRTNPLREDTDDKKLFQVS